MVYCFRCKVCGATNEQNTREQPNCHCGEVMVRDYKTELNSQTHFIPLHMSARNTSNKSDFLPSPKDFEKPGDSDGSKGMKEWKDTHKPVNSRWV